VSGESDHASLTIGWWACQRDGPTSLTVYIAASTVIGELVSLVSDNVMRPPFTAKGLSVSEVFCASVSTCEQHPHRHPQLDVDDVDGPPAVGEAG
jgi:hypothetical protein